MSQADEHALQYDNNSPANDDGQELTDEQRQDLKDIEGESKYESKKNDNI